MRNETKSLAIAITALAAAVLFSSLSFAADWPMWRYDAGRTADSPENLPDELHLLWSRQYDERETVWDDPLNQDLMPYDRIFEPVVAGKFMFVGFNDSDKIVAIDTDSGREVWTFRTGGPVRFAPAVWNGKVFASSDDGCLYCLDAKSGRLIWKHRGGPSDRKLLGNKRLISMWPARGGAVVSNGVVYYAASIWPMMGTFIYALDAETGDVAWNNDGNGSEYMRQPHRAPSFAGVAPQGSMVLAKDKLLIPGGRSVPAAFDRSNGKFLYYDLAGSGKTGGSFVASRGNVFFNHHREKDVMMYHLQTGVQLARPSGKYPVLAENTWYFSGDSVVAVRSGWVSEDMKELGAGKDADIADIAKNAARAMAENKLWETNVDASGDLIKAGNRLYAAGSDVITALDIPAATGTPAIAWKKTLDGSVERLLAADGKLFAVTLDGRIMAFGGKKAEPKLYPGRPAVSGHTAEAGKRAQEIIRDSGIANGYCILYGANEGELAEALINMSDLYVISVDPDPMNVLKQRERFDRAGLYGRRISVHEGTPGTFPAPQYMASLTIVADKSLLPASADSEVITNLYRSIRPYGGTMMLPFSGSDAARFETAVKGAKLVNAKLSRSNGAISLVREGPLPGSGIWTHNYGDPANTAKSDDDLVKLPLGILWFGGNSNTDVLPRHGHGPSEQVVGGRLFIEGVNSLSARDVYTGRVLWKTVLHDLNTYGVYYDASYKEAPTDLRYNQVHIPGANIRGTNYIATNDRIYVIQGADCLVLDSATGERVKTIRMPPVDPAAETPEYREWGYIAVDGDKLIGGYGFVPYTDLLMLKKAEYAAWDDFDNSASRGLVVMDRHSGETLWKTDAEIGFLHNGIAVGGGRIHCLDALPPHIKDQLSRRGRTTPEGSRLATYDLATGSLVWEHRENVFGSYLAYSDENGILLQSTRPSRDTVGGENGKHMTAYKASDGSVIWDRNLAYNTFPILHGKRIVTEGAIFSLLTGEPETRKDPITGNAIPWTWSRMYGCNYPVASEHLLTFRSGAAGFMDFDNMGGTGNFGGFKSGCTISLIAADGVLNAPDYTRTCNCPYQNQTSLALVYMPDADIEVWTFDDFSWDGAQVEKVGINFGAPGDRTGDDGTLWLDYPSVGGESPDLPVSVVPDNATWYRSHASKIIDGSYKWIAASGGEGIERIVVPLAKDDVVQKSYTVSLFFSEPENILAGERAFDVTVQGQRVAKNLDIIKETKGPNRTLVKHVQKVQAGKELVIELTKSPSSGRGPVISGIEIVAVK